MSAFLLLRHLILSQLTQKSISVSLNQFTNFRCAIAFAPFRNDCRTSESRCYKTGKQTVTGIVQYYSLEERSSQVLASKEVEPIKCSSHIWVDCHLWQLKTIRGTQRPSVSKYARWFSLWFRSLFG